MRLPQFYVYVMTDTLNQVLYIGVTNDLGERVQRHKQNDYPAFTTTYRLTKLIYYEIWETAAEAIERQKQLKHWHRQWKLNLIKELNHDLRDLSKELDGDT